MWYYKHVAVPHVLLHQTTKLINIFHSSRMEIHVCFLTGRIASHFYAHTPMHAHLHASFFPSSTHIHVHAYTRTRLHARTSTPTHTHTHTHLYEPCKYTTISNVVLDSVSCMLCVIYGRRVGRKNNKHIG